MMPGLPARASCLKLLPIELSSGWGGGISDCK